MALCSIFVQLIDLRKMQAKTLVESSTMTSLAKPQVPGQVKHYLQFADLTREEYDYLLKRSAWLKAKFKSYETWHPLHDRTLAMIFEKDRKSTRLNSSH